MIAGISQEELLDLYSVFGPGFSASYRIETADQVYIATRLSVDWRWISTGADVQFNKADLEFVFYDLEGNETMRFTGEGNAAPAAGDFSVIGGNHNRENLTTSYLFQDQNGNISSGTHTSEYIQAGTTETHYARYYLFISKIYMPVFTDLQAGYDFQGALSDYLQDPTDEKYEVLKEALKESENPPYPGKDKDKYGKEWSQPGGYGGGAGSYDDSSDTIAVPEPPEMGVTNVGLVNVYKVTTGALTALGNDIFPQITIPTSFNDIGDAIIKSIQALSDMVFNARLIDFVLDIHIIPVDVPAGSPISVKVGGKTCSPVGQPVTQNYVTVDLGKISIDEYFESFADYQYTNSKLFLPFIGFVDVKPEFWQHCEGRGELGIKYTFNVMDGTFMAYIVSSSSKSQLTDCVIAQYSGQCATHIPITGASYSTMVSGLISSGIEGATGAAPKMMQAAQGGAAGLLAAAGGPVGIAGGIASAAMNGIQNSQPEMKHSNSYSSSSSMLSIKKPFLMIDRPSYSFSESYVHENGIPANTDCKLGDISGFAMCENVILNFPCTDEESRAIIAALREGVIL